MTRAKRLLNNFELKKNRSDRDQCFRSERSVTEHLTRTMADKILKAACKRVGLGGGTHS